MTKGGTPCRLEEAGTSLSLSISIRHENLVPHGTHAEPHGSGVYIPLYIQGMYGSRPEADGRIPYGVSPDWLPTAVGLRPTRVVS